MSGALRLLGDETNEEAAVATALELQDLEHTRAAKRSRITRIGLLGCGVVGSEVARALLDNEKAAGSQDRRLSLERVAVAHPAKERSVHLTPGAVTDDALAVVKDPSIDVIVELIGGAELCYPLLRQALIEGKSVVTANKEVVALHGAELSALAADRGLGFYFEGAVGGAVPVIHAITESFAADRVVRFCGVLNGTSNYVLDLVAETGCLPDKAVAAAQALGYAERDPSDDLNGLDAARKAAILATLAFGCDVRPEHMIVRGIEELSTEDVLAAKRLGYATKLVVHAETFSGFAYVGVEPWAVPVAHPLAQVRRSDNLLLVDAEFAGRVALAGAGAGGRQTASAVLGDLHRAVRGAPPPAFEAHEPEIRVLKDREAPARFLLRCVATQPLVQEEISGRLFNLGVAVEDSAQWTAANGSHEVVLTTGWGERSCIERSLRELEDKETFCWSLLKVADWDWIESEAT